MSRCEVTRPARTVSIAGGPAMPQQAPIRAYMREINVLVGRGDDAVMRIRFNTDYGDLSITFSKEACSYIANCIPDDETND